MDYKMIFQTAKRLEDIGFKIFDSDRFAEFYISELIGARREDRRNSHCDCVLNGDRIEIKHSKLIEGLAKGRNKHYAYKYFHWAQLYGTNGSKKGQVDILILSGWGNDEWYFWVIPYQEVKHHKVEYQISKRRSKSWSWLEPYYIGDEKSLQEYFNAKN
jgi:hypothetical protein